MRPSQFAHTHTYCNMLWYFVATAAPISLPALTQHHSNVRVERSFDFPWYNFFCYYYDYFSSGSDWVLEADWSTWTSILSLCLLFSIWSLSLSSRSFWTLSKYESIKCQVPFRLLFNVNGINIFGECCTNNFNESICLAVVIYSATWWQHEKNEIEMKY